MSYTSEEESEINFQQQHKLAVCEAALSKGSPIIPAAKKRRSHPGNPGKKSVTAYFSIREFKYTYEQWFSGFQLPQTQIKNMIALKMVLSPVINI
jgi:hypothetical protein